MSFSKVANFISHIVAPTATRKKANSSSKDKRFYILLSAFHRVNVTYSPLTDYICSRVKGGPSTRIYLCKRLPNYQSWFSTSLNFLIGLPFWLPLITRFHIPLMMERGRERNVHTRSHMLTVYIRRRAHTDTYAPLSMSTRLIFYLSLRCVSFGVCACVCVTCALQQLFLY